MEHYIKNIKQCFTDKNVKIIKIKFGYDWIVLITKTFNYIPDMGNTNSFVCSKSYYNYLKKKHSVYHGLPRVTY